MRWYDYIVCVVIADFIAAAIIVQSWTIIFPIIWYLIYEDMRKWQISQK